MSSLPRRRAVPGAADERGGPLHLLRSGVAMTARDHLRMQVEMHEGFRPLAYDDGTGRPVKPGVTVKGHVTVGIGRALDVRGISLEEARWLLDRDLEESEQGLRDALPWFGALDDVRQQVLVELAFQCGVRGLLNFKKMLAAVMGRDWVWAVAELKNSRWATQVASERVDTLARQLETGQW